MSGSTDLRRRSRLLINGIVVIALITACGSDSGDSDTDDSSLRSGPSDSSLGSASPTTIGETTDVSLQLDFSWVADHTAFIQAAEDGGYEAHGLDVSLQQGQGSGTTMALVGSGEAAFGWGDLSSAALAISKGVPIKVVAVVTQQTPFGTQCFNDVGFTEPKDLEGHSVILIPEESTSQLWPAYLSANGVDPAKVTVVNATFANKFSLFAQHRADCMPDYYGIGLDLTRFLNPDIDEPIAWQDNGINVLSQGLVVNADFAAANPDVVKEFVAASLEAWTAVCDDTTTASEYFIDEHPELNEEENDRKLTQARIDYECAATQPASGGTGAIGAVTDEQWNEMLETLHEFGGMEELLPVGDYYTDEYLPE